MNKKKICFYLDEAEIELECGWNYSFTPGKYYGKPEDCYPESEESDVELPKDFEEQIRRFALDVMVPKWIKMVEDEAERLRVSDAPREWAKDEDDRGDYEKDLYDDMIRTRGEW